MGNVSPEAITDLLQNLDGLDVLEFIDFHPESIQREGDIIRAFCPICQRTDDRYLTIDLTDNTFVSAPPDIPAQKGNLVDLYARVRRLSLDEAASQLADEFGVLLIQPESTTDTSLLREEALDFLAKAEQSDGTQRRDCLLEAEKRLTRVAGSSPKDIRTLEGLQRLRLLESNPVSLFQATRALLDVLKSEEKDEKAVEACKRHLTLVPDDWPIRQDLAEAYTRAGHAKQAVAEYMSIAERAESTSQIDDAVKAYRRVQEIGPDIVDVHPLILNLFEARGRKKDMAEEIRSEVKRRAASGDTKSAMQAAIAGVKRLPEQDELRLTMVEMAIQAGLDSEGLDQSLRMVDQLIDRNRLDMAAEALGYLTGERPAATGILKKLVEVYRLMKQDEVADELEMRLVEVSLEHGLTQDAEALLNKRLERNPEDMLARMVLARAMADQGRREDAVNSLHELVDVCLMSLDEARALEAVRMICRIDPERWEDREREIEMIWAMGNHDEANNGMERLVADLEKRKLHDRAIAVLEGHLHREPDNIHAIGQLADVYTRMGDTRKSGEIRKSTIARMLEKEGESKAENALQEFLKSDPGNPDLLEQLADIQLKRGEKSAYRNTILEMCAALRKSGRLTDECRVLKDLVKEMPADLEVLDRLFAASKLAGNRWDMVEAAEKQIDLLVTGSDFNNALSKAEAVLALQPDHEGALKSLITIYNKLGKKADAARIARQLSEKYASEGQPRQELEILQAVLQSNPGDIDARERVVELHAELKDLDQTSKQIREFLARHTSERDRAINLMRRVLKTTPELIGVRQELIKVLKHGEREDEMVEELQKLAEQYEESRQTDKLPDIYDELLRVRPDNLIARSRLVELLRLNRRTAEAVEQQLFLAQQYRDARQLTRAAAAYEQMEADDPGNEDVLQGHATVLVEMGNTQAAAAKTRQLAGLLADKGRTNSAVTLLRDILEKDPDNYECRQALVEILRNSQQFQEAATELRAMAEHQAETGDAKGAIVAMREALAMEPAKLENRQLLVKLLEKVGRHEEAEAELLHMAEGISKQGQPQRALTVTDEILQKNPASLPARRLRAQIYDSIGEEKQALSEYREMQNYLDRVTVSRDGTGKDSDEETGGFYPGLQVMPEYDFDSFVVGDKNNFAYATAKAVTDQPGSIHNPLFLYSDVGLGKTHLLHAIANELKRRRPDIRILYASTEYFTSALIEAIQNNTVTAFRTRHRKSDVLLLDDVQFLAGKERSQEEFFHIFNILHQDGRQIVVTSDRPPKDIAHLDKRIRSRFGQGVIVDIQPPDLETRIAILRAEAERRSVDSPTVSDAIIVIAERISTNIRELKGAFNQLLTQHQLCGDELTAATATNIVDKFFAT